MTTINYFGTGKDAGENSFLSNFYWHRDDVTVEHLYQAEKTDDPEWKHRILEAPTPAAAKKLGRKAPMRPHWDTEKVVVMTRLLRIKFAHGSEIAQQLLDTGDAELIEGNWWGDTFWGQCRGVGENWLGRLLMQRREELRHGVRAKLG